MYDFIDTQNGGENKLWENALVLFYSPRTEFNRDKWIHSAIQKKKLHRYLLDRELKNAIHWWVLFSNVLENSINTNKKWVTFLSFLYELWDNINVEYHYALTILYVLYYCLIYLNKELRSSILTIIVLINQVFLFRLSIDNKRFLLRFYLSQKIRRALMRIDNKRIFDKTVRITDWAIQLIS